MALLTFTNVRDNTLLKLLNEILFLAFLGTNIFCLVQGLYGHGHDIFLAPASMTYGVWTVIQVLFIGTLFYQWSDAGKDIIIDGLKWRLALIFLLTTSYLHLWVHKEWLAAFIFAIFVSATVTQTYYIVKTEYPAQGILDELLVHTPISMLQAWTTFLVLAAAFEAFGERTGWEPKPWTKIYFVASLVALEFAAAAYAFALPEGDVIANITITWTLYCLSRRLNSYFLYTAQWWATIVSIIFLIKSIHGFYRTKYTTFKQELVGGEITLGPSED